MMFSSAYYRKAFESWWLYYSLKWLYDYDHKELREFVDYHPGPSKIEKERYAWYIKLKPAPTQDDVNTDMWKGLLQDREEWDSSA
jgi:hypothetical protein